MDHVQKVCVLVEGKQMSPTEFTKTFFESESGIHFSDEDKAIINRFWELVEYPNSKSNRFE